MGRVTVPLGLLQLSSAIFGFLVVLFSWSVSVEVPKNSQAGILYHPSRSVSTNEWNEATVYSARYPCGTNSSTANARGCAFELATGTWQLPECTHLAEETKFRGLRDWKFYVYKNATFGDSHPSINGIHNRRDLEEVSIHELPDLGPAAQVWTTWEFHLYRCAWLWKRDVLAANGNITGPVGGRQHCIDDGLAKESRYSLGDIVTGYRVRYQSCMAPPDYVV
jgi:hypothetical protein